MNTWGYLILIAALLVLSAYMLYARFAARSREKSLHHAPTGSISHRVTPRVEPQVTDEDKNDLPVMDLKPLEDEAPTDPGEKSEKKKEDTYFDELQDAAAGLAMLMRSSPALDRSEPVVFAPEAEENCESADRAAVDPNETDERPEPVAGEALPVTEEAVIELDEPDSVSVNGEEAARAESGESMPGPEFSEGIEGTADSSFDDAIDQVEAVLSEAPMFEGESHDLADGGGSADLEASSLVALLGQEVAGQFSRLDDGLDELESLVADIEEQLSRLDEFVSAPVEETIEEAA